MSDLFDAQARDDEAGQADDAADAAPAGTTPEAQDGPEKVESPDGAGEGGSVETSQASKDIVEDDKAPKWARDAVVSERRKRQDAERRLQALEAARAQPAAAAQPQVSGGSDDDAFYQAPVEYTRRAIEQAVSQRTVAMSEALVRAQYPDAGDALAAFEAAAVANPALVAQMMAHPHPGLYAYQTGKTYAEVSRYGGSLDEMRKALKAEALAELKAEMAKQNAPASKSMASARGSARGKESYSDDENEPLFRR